MLEISLPSPCLVRTIPRALPGIMFLSGGQTEEEATVNLHVINQLVGVGEQCVGENEPSEVDSFEGSIWSFKFFSQNCFCYQYCSSPHTRPSWEPWLGYSPPDAHTIISTHVPGTEAARGLPVVSVILIRTRLAAFGAQAMGIRPLQVC